MVLRTLLVDPRHCGAGGAHGVEVRPDRGPGGVDEGRHQEDQREDGEHGQQHEERRGVEQQEVEEGAEEAPALLRQLAPALGHLAGAAAALALVCTVVRLWFQHHFQR